MQNPDLSLQEIQFLTSAVQNYYKDPNLLSPEQRAYLVEKGRELGVTVDPEKEEPSFIQKVGEYLGQPVVGFLEGATTFSTDTIKPKNDIQGILRSIGHLAGFVVGVPKIGAEIAEAGVKRLISKEAKQAMLKAIEGKKFLTAGANILRSGLRLGTMSAISNWQQGIDGMLSASLGGTEAGIGFHLLSYINPAKKYDAIRMLASALYTGIPSTLRGDTTPQQVYEYLLGAYFGRHGRDPKIDQLAFGDQRIKSKIAELEKAVNQKDLYGLLKSLGYLEESQKNYEKFSDNFSKAIIDGKKEEAKRHLKDFFKSSDVDIEDAIKYFEEVSKVLRETDKKVPEKEHLADSYNSFANILKAFRENPEEVFKWIENYSETPRESEERQTPKPETPAEGSQTDSKSLKPETDTKPLPKEESPSESLSGAKKEGKKVEQESIQEVAKEQVEQKTERVQEPPKAEEKIVGFQGYKGGYDPKGKGRPEGDGKDKAMREVADSAIVELAHEKPSSSRTTLEKLGEPTEKSKVVMLARNGTLHGKPLLDATKKKILEAHKRGAEFVVGDMRGVDDRFVNYLEEIGAKYTIYHTGEKPGFTVEELPAYKRKMREAPKQEITQPEKEEQPVVEKRSEREYVVRTRYNAKKEGRSYIVEVKIDNEGNERYEIFPNEKKLFSILNTPSKLRNDIIARVDVERGKSVSVKVGKATYTVYRDGRIFSFKKRDFLSETGDKARIAEVRAVAEKEFKEVDKKLEVEFDRTDEGRIVRQVQKIDYLVPDSEHARLTTVAEVSRRTSQSFDKTKEYISSIKHLPYKEFAEEVSRELKLDPKKDRRIINGLYVEARHYEDRRHRYLVLSDKGLGEFPTIHPDTLRKLPAGSYPDNLPEDVLVVRGFDYNPSSIFRERELIERETKTPFENYLREKTKGYTILGSPSDRDQLLVVRSKFEGKTKGQIEKEAKWLLEEFPFLKGEVWEKLDDVEAAHIADYFSAIKNIWGDWTAPWVNKLVEKKGFHGALAEIIKRLQIPSATGKPIQSEPIRVFNERVLSREGNKIYAIVIKDPTLLGVPEANDGATFDHPVLYNTVLNSIGEKPNADAYKSFTHDVNKRFALSEKSATFRANEKLARFMEEIGVGRIILETAAKVHEGIEPVEIRFNEKKGRWEAVVPEGKNIEDYVFQITPEKQRFKFQAHLKENNKVPFLRQMMDFVERSDKEAWNSLMKEVIEPAVEEYNALMFGDKKKGLKGAVNSPAELQAIVLRLSKDLSVVDEELTYRPDFESSEVSNDVNSIAPFLARLRAGYKTGEPLLSTPMRNIVLKMLSNNFLRDAIIRRRLAGNIFVIRPWTPDVGIKIKRSEIILPKSMENYEYEGRTLKEIFEKDGEIPFEVVFGRSPVSAVNAVTVGKIAGFHEGESTAIIHPADVKKIKGDHDIDKIHVFFNMPKGVIEYYKRNANRQDEKGYRYESAPELRPDTGEKDIPFSQNAIVKMAGSINAGKSAVGLVANWIGRYIRASYLQKEQGDKPFIYEEKNKKGQVSKYKFRIRTKPEDDKAIREMLDEWLNTATDAAKVGGVPERERIVRDILDHIIEWQGEVPKNPTKVLSHPIFDGFKLFRNITSRKFVEGQAKVLDFNELSFESKKIEDKEPVLATEEIAKRIKYGELTFNSYLDNKRLNSIKAGGLRFSYKRPRSKFARTESFNREVSNFVNRVVIAEHALGAKVNLSALRGHLNRGYIDKAHKLLSDAGVEISKESLEVISKVTKIHRKMFKTDRETGEGINKLKRLQMKKEMDALVKEHYFRLTENSSIRERENFLWLLGYEKDLTRLHGYDIELGGESFMKKQAYYNSLVFASLRKPEIVESLPPIQSKDPVEAIEELKLREPVPVEENGKKEPVLKTEESKPLRKNPYQRTIMDLGRNIESIWSERISANHREWDRSNRELSELYDRLKKYPDFVENFDGFVRWFTGGKTIKDLTYFDIKGINYFLRDIESGGIIRRLRGKKPEDVKWLDWILFPEKVADERMKFERQWIPDDKTGGMKPVSTLHRLIDVMHNANREYNAMVDEWLNESGEMDKFFGFLKRVDRNGEPISARRSMWLQEISVAKYEQDASPEASEKWAVKYKKEYEKLSEVDKEIVDKLVEAHGKFADYVYDKLVVELDKLITNIKREEFGKDVVQETGKREKYFPHNWRSDKEFIEHFQKKVERVVAEMKAEGAPKEKIDEFIEKMDQTLEKIMKHRSIPEIETGLDETPADFKTVRTFVHSLPRKLNVDGYIMTIEAWTDYIRRLAKSYIYTNAAYKAREILDRFEKDPSFDKRWAKFYKIYVLDALGYPSKEYPEFGKNLYNLTSDEAVVRRLRSIGINVTYPGQLVQWSNAEAKYELMSLLFSTKTYIYNMLGGSANTIIKYGRRNFLDAGKMLAGDTKFVHLLPVHLRELVLSQDKTKRISMQEAVKRMIDESGVIEEFLAHEAFLGKQAAKGVIKDFLHELQDGITNKTVKNWSDVVKLGKKYKLSDAVVNKSAYFMRVSEKRLRAQAYLSAFLHAKRAGIQDDFLAMNIAERGVKATQYLYNNAFRPAYSRTALGKLLSRFQLWSWNSVKFRREVYEEARRAGFKPGSEGFIRLKRLMAFDLFMLAMTNIFAMSLFESTLPPPLSYLQDTAQLLFGDDKDREKAFFGTYGLSLIQPPITRIPFQFTKALISGEWDRFLSYHAWAMFPFGRFARDVVRTMNSPELVPEIWTGVPVHQIGRYLRKDLEPIPHTKFF